MPKKPTPKQFAKSAKKSARKSRKSKRAKLGSRTPRQMSAF